MRLLDDPDNPRRQLLPDEAEDYRIIRVLQTIGRGWTWEYAEEFVRRRPDKVQRIFDALLVQRAVQPRGLWFS